AEAEAAQDRGGLLVVAAVQVGNLASRADQEGIEIRLVLGGTANGRRYQLPRDREPGRAERTDERQIVGELHDLRGFASVDEVVHPRWDRWQEMVHGADVGAVGDAECLELRRQQLAHLRLLALELLPGAAEGNGPA